MPLRRHSSQTNSPVECYALFAKHFAVCTHVILEQLNQLLHYVRRRRLMRKHDVHVCNLVIETCNDCCSAESVL